jgi:Fe2+ or Zn2+ uptake regulation protein
LTTRRAGGIVLREGHVKRTARTDDSLVDRMKAKGLRLTGQRKVLADLLEHADEHLDAESVYQRAKAVDHTIHRATVYRTLNKLKKLGLVDELDLMHVSGERHYYEIRPRTLHIHLVCTTCKGVEEPSETFWEDLKRRVRSDNGFLPEVVRIEMAGVCSSCQRKRSRQPA